MKPESRIYVAGHRGLVGSAIVRRLRAGGFSELITRSRTELDLLRQASVEEFFANEKPEFVFLAAARVGGIQANNTRRGEFIYENLVIQSNVIEAARQHDCQRLLFLGSSCIYPRDCRQPMREQDLLSGPLESTNEPYAIAKIAGLKLCEAYNRQYGSRYLAVMPTNLYGPGDNFDLESSHVIPALIRKVHEAKTAGAAGVSIWGTGKPLREFLYVDDMADACVYLMGTERTALTNIGSGEEVSIRRLAELVCEVVGFDGKLEFDESRPDGTARKLLDVRQLHDQGWHHQVDLRAGLERTYRWYLENKPPA
ncbi:MAG: GDP-L-fucose synthase [Gammaproteobacteria bacterium]|nr:GDP-L-fucose synthase [Gammaproteobacteria bacterium]